VHGEVTNTMKKQLALLTSIVMAAALIGCKKEEKAEGEHKAAEATTEAPAAAAEAPAATEAPAAEAPAAEAAPATEEKAH